MIVFYSTVICFNKQFEIINTQYRGVQLCTTRKFNNENKLTTVQIENDNYVTVLK